jgi:hypothetical protein
MYGGVERRSAPRHQGPKAGVISLEQDALVGCTVRDFSPSGVGLSLPDVVHLPSEFDLTFSHTNHHCIAVWRQLDRMGLKFKLTDCPVRPMPTIPKLLSLDDDLPPMVCQTKVR